MEQRNIRLNDFHITILEIAFHQFHHYLIKCIVIFLLLTLQILFKRNSFAFAEEAPHATIPNLQFEIHPKIIDINILNFNVFAL
jgi:hypothetical protein